MLKFFNIPCNSLKPLLHARVFNTCKIPWAVIFQVYLPPTRKVKFECQIYTHLRVQWQVQCTYRQVYLESQIDEELEARKDIG